MISTRGSLGSLLCRRISLGGRSLYYVGGSHSADVHYIMSGDLTRRTFIILCRGISLGGRSLYSGILEFLRTNKRNSSVNSNYGFGNRWIPDRGDLFFGIQTGGSSARLNRGSSRVGFLPSQVKPPTDVPVDLTKEVFDAVEDVQRFTLQPSQLAVVIASYDKTIGRFHIFVFTPVFLH